MTSLGQLGHSTLSRCDLIFWPGHEVSYLQKCRLPAAKIVDLTPEGTPRNVGSTPLAERLTGFLLSHVMFGTRL